ncbi:MAG: amidase family protein, partial [Raoultibacter sp.]
GAQTRTVEDSAWVLNEMAYYEPRDPFSIDWGKRDFTEALGASIEGKRIGFTADFGVYAVDPEIARMVEQAAYRLREAGAIVEPVEFSINHTHMELAEAWCRLVSITGMEAIEGFKAGGIDLLKDYSEDLSPELIYWINDTYRRDYLDYNHDDTIRTEVFDAMQTAFESYDFIISPTNACHPVKNDPNRNTVGPKEINGEQVEPLIGWCLTYFCNFTGHPAISVPAGLSEEGFPVGMQIIGNRFDDKGVLSVGSAFEKIQPWIHTYQERLEDRAL